MPIDYNRYPPNWHTEIRPRILTRAKHCCEKCGVPNYEFIWRPKGTDYWELMPDDVECGPGMPMHGIKFVRVVLTIAHLDHDPDNWEVKDERLKALCQRCHLRLDLSRHIENRKYGRDWRKYQLTLNLQ